MGGTPKSSTLVGFSLTKTIYFGCPHSWKPTFFFSESSTQTPCPAELFPTMTASANASLSLETPHQWDWGTREEFFSTSYPLATNHGEIQPIFAFLKGTQKSNSK